MKLAQKEVQKSQKCYKKRNDEKAIPRRLEVGDQALVLLPTESNKLLCSGKGHTPWRVKIGSKTKTYVNMLKKYMYIAREPEVDVVHTSNKDDATTAVARVVLTSNKDDATTAVAGVGEV